MEDEEITRLELELEEIVKKDSEKIIRSIAFSLRYSLEGPQQITSGTPYFHIMQSMGFLPMQYSEKESNIHGETLIFYPTEKARELYNKLKESEYYGENT